MKSAIVVFPGSNRESDVLRGPRACVGSDAAKVWHADADLPSGTDLVVLPGGFSYGDYLRCGAIAGRAPIMDAVRAHAARGGLRARHLQRLPDPVRSRAAARRADAQRQPEIHLPSPDPARRAQRHRLHPALPQGRGRRRLRSRTARATTSPTTRRSRALEGEGLVAFRYCDGRGAITEDANRNGSMNAIAGIYSQELNVLGMMPHPENLIDDLVGGTDGRACSRAS